MEKFTSCFIDISIDINVKELTEYKLQEKIHTEVGIQVNYI